MTPFGRKPVKDLIKSLLKGVQPARVIIELTLKAVNSLLLVEASIIDFFEVITNRLFFCKEGTTGVARVLP